MFIKAQIKVNGNAKIARKVQLMSRMYMIILNIARQESITMMIILDASTNERQ